MARDGKATETMMNLLTVLALLTAVGFVTRDRVLPAIRERQVVDPGERIPPGLAVRDLATGDTVALSELSPFTFLAFLSTCPSCERTTPAWREVIDSEDSYRERFAAISLGNGPDAARWADRELPGVRLFEPLDRARFVSLLRIEVVPTVLSIGNGNRLIERREGVLGPAEARALLQLSSTRASGTGE